MFPRHVFFILMCIYDFINRDGEILEVDNLHSISVIFYLYVSYDSFVTLVCFLFVFFESFYLFINFLLIYLSF